MSILITLWEDGGKAERALLLFCAAMILLLILIFFSSPIIAYATQDEAVVTVVRVEKEIKSDGKGKYIVTGEEEVFENTDTVWYWKWNSSDVQGKLREGGQYKVRVYGWRWPLLSWYRNIISVEGTVKEPKTRNLEESIRTLVDNEAIDDKAFREAVRKLIQ